MRTIFVRLPFGLSFPVPLWTTQGFGVLALCAVALYLYKAANPGQPEMLTLQQANAQLEAEVREYGAHMADAPTSVYADAEGLFTIRSYADRCVLIQRRSGPQVLSRLVVDLARAEAPHDHIPTRSGLGIEPVAEAAGRCLDPHPGAFQTAYGQRHDQCVVEVWRRWPDGCEHWQLLDACRGAFQSNPDGSPLVHWTRCFH